MNKVTYEEFYAVVAQMDVHPTIEGRYPYHSVFKTRTGSVVGVIDENGFYYLK